jgi:rhodanese-related sulfurtransferase
MSKNTLLLSKKQITSSELEQILEARSREEADFLLVDIREPYEYESGHISGVDMLLPTSQFREWAALLKEQYADIPLIITCRTANRTGQVQGILEQMGMDNVIDHTGGIVSYTGAIEQGMGGLRDD